MPDKLFIGQKARQVDRSPKLGGITGLRMLIDEKTEVNAGDLTSSDAVVWEINSPWASQSQVDWLLTRMQGYEYQPYVAETAQLDPAAELGDYVTVGNVYSGLFSESNTFSSMFTSDISAPSQKDIDHEYPYKSESERRFSRVVKNVAAEFQIAYNRIDAKVSQIGGDNRSFGWSMTVDGMTWWANGDKIIEATQAGLEVWGHIKGGTIQIGSGFSVDEEGNMSANSATLTGTLTVEGQEITAERLRVGATSGYDWSNRSYSAGGSSYPSKANYSLTGGSWGLNYRSAANINVQGPDWFTVGNLGVRGRGAYWYFNHGVTVTIGTKTYCMLGYEVTG